MVQIYLLILKDTGIFMLDHEQALQTYSRNPKSNKKLREQFFPMDPKDKDKEGAHTVNVHPNAVIADICSGPNATFVILGMFIYVVSFYSVPNFCLR